MIFSGHVHPIWKEQREICRDQPIPWVFVIECLALFLIMLGDQDVARRLTVVGVGVTTMVS